MAGKAIRIHGRRYSVSGKTRTIVERKLAELQRQWAVGELVPPSRITVSEHLDDFLADCERSVRAKTVREYSSVVRLYLRPWFGHVKLQALSAPLISQAFGKLEREGRLSGKSILNIFRVLSRAIEVAVRWGRIGRNPCKSVEPRRRRSGDQTFGAQNRRGNLSHT
ncbi:MAG: hypothetical protein U5Q44_08295 [Dehalococcoidia bacterium]|nr:hypothetical protein [Dehalococcoidia bacterium]